MCLRDKRELPDFIKNSPELITGLELYFNAFLDLENDRSVGFGIGPISWSVINEYCVVNDIVDDQRHAMFYHIRKMDALYIDLMTEISKKDKKTGK